MALTGWTYDQLCAQPAPVVRALMHRVFATAAWDAGVARVARRPPGDRSAYGSLGAWAAARRTQLDASRYVEEMQAVLWPEDGR